MSIGRVTEVKCKNGFINGDYRCPWYQQTSNVTPINRMLDLPWVSVSTLGQWFNQMQDDFWNIGQYVWSCTHYPGINSNNIEIKLYGKDGKFYTVEEVMTKYTNDYYLQVENDDTMEVTDAPEGDQQYHQ